MLRSGCRRASRAGGPAVEVIGLCAQLPISTLAESGAKAQVLLPVELDGNLLAAEDITVILLNEGASSVTNIEVIREWSVNSKSWTEFTSGPLASLTGDNQVVGTAYSTRTSFGPLARFILRFWTGTTDVLASGSVTALLVIRYHV